MTEPWRRRENAAMAICAVTGPCICKRDNRLVASSIGISCGNALLEADAAIAELSKEVSVESPAVIVIARTGISVIIDHALEPGTAELHGVNGQVVKIVNLCPKEGI